MTLILARALTESKADCLESLTQESKADCLESLTQGTPYYHMIKRSIIKSEFATSTVIFFFEAGYMYRQYN